MLGQHGIELADPGRKAVDPEWKYIVIMQQHKHILRKVATITTVHYFKHHNLFKSIGQVDGLRVGQGFARFPATIFQLR